MRQLPSLKALLHAINLVRNFLAVGIRFCLPWTVILAALSVANLLINPPADDLSGPPTLSALDITSLVIGIVAFCSNAVNWHRFILRDETGGKPLRLDGDVWRYMGNFILILIMALVPLVALAVALTILLPVAFLLLVPAGLLAGTFATALSVKLPAVALGRRDFGFRDALAATQNSFWPLLGVFAINSAVLLASVIALAAVTSAIVSVNFAVGAIVGVAASMVANILYTLYSISVVSSLYGFFVEKRDF